MNKITFAVIAVLALFVCASAPPASACPHCSGNWVTVPTGTTGTGASGTGYGAVVTERGQTFQCDPVPTPSNPSTNTNTNTNNNSNSNSNSNKNTNTNNNSSNSNSNSNSSSVGIGVGIGEGGKGGQGGKGGNGYGGSVSGSGNSTNTIAVSANPTATGGNATGGSVGPISIDQGPVTATSGPSTSTSTATGGNQKQGQTQSSTSAASNNGNGSNNASYTSNDSYVGARIPVTTAYAPTVAPTAQCFKGWGAGVQFPQVGGSIGGGKIDDNCAILEAARSGANYASKEAYCMVWISNKYVKKAGVTLAICLADATPKPVEEPRVPVALFVPGQGVPAPVLPEPQVRIITPAPVVVPPVETKPFGPFLIGICTFAPDLQCQLPSGKPDPTRVTSVCDEMIASAIRLLNEHPGSKLRLVGNANRNEREANTMFALSRAKNVERKLTSAGVFDNRITVEVGTNNTRTVELWLE